jgi:hypothetical protein
MSCDLKQVGANLLQLPKITLPSISRPGVEGIETPEKSSCEELQDTFSVSTPFGGKLKLPCPTDGFKGKQIQTLQLGREVLNLVSAFMTPIEVAVELVKPIQEGLSALTGLTDPTDIVDALVDIADTLITILSTLTGTYPAILIAEILQIVNEICQAISDIKQYLQQVTQAVEQLTSNITQAASEITQSITQAVTDATSKALLASISYSDRASTFDEDFDNAISSQEDLLEQSKAAYTLIVGGAPKLASEGLSDLSDVIVPGGVEKGQKRLKNFLIGDTENPTNKGIRGRVKDVFSSQATSVDEKYQSTLEKIGLRRDRRKLVVQNFDLQLNNELPKLQDCFEESVEELGELGTKFLQTSQQMVSNVLEGATEELTGMLSNLVVPIIGQIPTCP